MDVLTDVLHALQLRSTLYCRAELRAPWALSFAPTRAAAFHVVDRGSCWLRVDGSAELLPLAGGDLVVLPHGVGHQIADTPEREGGVPIQLDTYASDRCEVRQSDGEGAATTLLCGLFDFAHDHGHPLIALLPPLLHVRGESGQAVPWLSTTLKYLASEAGSPRPGAETIVRRLTDILFIQVVRAWVEQEGDGSRGWLGALRDPAIGAALGLIHQQPEQPWTVASLAAAVALSRSAFAARFSALVGAAPLQYLTRWRLRTAARLLTDGQLSLTAVAQRVGYDSEVAFSTAFKRELGTPPGAYRRQQGSRN